ncbi:MAG: hypothetical protein WCO10_03495 [bacterium]
MVKGGDIVRALNEFDFTIVSERSNEEYRLYILAINHKHGQGIMISAKNGRNRFNRGSRLTKVDQRKVVATVLDSHGHPLVGVQTLCSTRLTEIHSLIRRIAEGAYKRAA